MTQPEGKHFALDWYIVVSLAVLASLPLEFLGWTHWSVISTGVALFAMGMFVGGETASKDLPPEIAGTMTHFMYLRIAQNWLRVLIGVWLSALIGWRLNIWLGGAFMLWLPWHYSGMGPGIVDRFAQFITGGRVRLS